MGLDGFAESSAVLSSFKKILLKWEKHCSTLQSLANQIQGIERCEKDIISLREETFHAVHITIQSKIMEELHNLSQDLMAMEVEHASLISIHSKILAQCQHFLEQKDEHAEEFQQLRTVDSICNHMAVLIAMKKIPLVKAAPDDFQSLQEFKQINLSTKSLETELEKVSYLLEN